jgi:hypothetical protein
MPYWLPHDQNPGFPGSWMTIRQLKVLPDRGDDPYINKSNPPSIVEQSSPPFQIDHSHERTSEFISIISSSYVIHEVIYTSYTRTAHGAVQNLTVETLWSVET